MASRRQVPRAMCAVCSPQKLARKVDPSSCQHSGNLARSRGHSCLTNAAPMGMAVHAEDLTRRRTGGVKSAGPHRAADSVLAEIERLV